MKLKKVFMAMMLLVVTFVVTGCRMDYTFDISNPSKLVVKTDVYYSVDEVKKNDLNITDKSKYSIVKLEDGKTYYKFSESETSTWDDYFNTTSLNGTITPDMVYIPVSEVEERSKAQQNAVNLDEEEFKKNMQFYMSFTFGKEIVDTNGKLSKDKKTVTFDVYETNVKGFYAYTDAGKNKVEIDKKPPVITGLKKNVYYNGLYFKDLKIYDDTGLASVTCNGIKMTYNENYGWMLKSVSLFKYKQGKNKIVATDISGNKTTYIFLYDSKAPTVKNIKNKSTKKARNKKIEFYVLDKDSGLKKIMYSKNNQKPKQIPSKNITKVKKGKFKGYYKVTLKCNKPCTLDLQIFDKAGNTTNIENVTIY